MCFGEDARPPLPPISGAALDSRDLTLASADGASFAALGARAIDSGGAGVLVLPDVRGLHPYYGELAIRLAEAGAHAVSVDLYSRTAGAAKRGLDFEYEPHVLGLRHHTIVADVAAAAAHLRSPDGGSAERIYTLGFCLGGRVSFLQAAEPHALDGVIGFYGWPVGEHRTGLPAPADRASDFRCPVLAIYGGADPRIGHDVVAEFDRALDAAGVIHESVVYDGAPHSFFDRLQAEHAEASADAWRRVLRFMGLGERPEA